MTEATSVQGGQKPFIFNDNLEAFRTDEAQIAEVMIQAVSRHAQAGADNFSPLQHDTDIYPFQRADCIAAMGKAATYHDMLALAPFIYPNFPNFVDRLMDERADLLSAVAGAAENEKDITVATDHRQIIGLAVAHCALVAALYESGNIEHGDIDTEIIVSEMLKSTMILGMPAVELLMGIFSVSRFVVPAANRTNKLQLPKGYADVANASSVESRHESDKPRITAVAMSATGDVYSPARYFGKHKRKKGYYMAPPTDGTIEEYALHKYVVPMSVDLTQSGAEFVGRLHRDTQVNSKTEAYLIMNEIADGISSVSNKKSFFVPDMNKFQKIKEQVEKRRTHASGS